METHGIPKPTNCSVAVPALATPTSPHLAQQENWLNNYVDAGFHHMWEDPKNMGDQEVYKNAMLSSGFNISDLLKKIQTNEVKEHLITNTKRAVEKGVFGVPTFFLGNQMFFGKERLMQIESTLSD